MLHSYASVKSVIQWHNVTLTGVILSSVFGHFKEIFMLKPHLIFGMHLPLHLPWATANLTSIQDMNTSCTTATGEMDWYSLWVGRTTWEAEHRAVRSHRHPVISCNNWGVPADVSVQLVLHLLFVLKTLELSQMSVWESSLLFTVILDIMTESCVLLHNNIKDTLYNPTFTFQHKSQHSSNIFSTKDFN